MEQYALHIPVHDRVCSVSKFAQALKTLDWIAEENNLPRFKLYTQDDSWNVWGEPDVWTHTAARHLIVGLDEIPTLEDVKNIIDELSAYFENGEDYQVGDFSVLSTAEDWSAEITTFFHVANDTTVYPMQHPAP